MEIKQKIKSFILKVLTRKKDINFDIKSSKKVLIFRYDRIGDMILTTPIFRELKKTYPDIEITVLASKTNEEVIRYNPYVSEIYTNYKNNILIDLFTLIKLRRKNFDVCIELDHSVVTHAIIRHKIIKPKKIISVFKYGRYGVQGSEIELYDFYSNKNNENHFSRIWLDTLIFFGIDSKSTKYDIFLSGVEQQKAKLFISGINEKFKIGINVEAFSSEKRLDTAKINKICKDLYEFKKNIKIILISSPKFRKNLYEIINEIDLKYVCLSYKTESIIDVAALIKELDIVITPDTSIVHVASAFNIPVVSIHENNKESYRLWAPKSSLNRTVFAKSRVGLFNYNINEIVSSVIDIIDALEVK